ncbi:MAG: ABC transporter permease [Planctomycetota bacterium]
MVSRSTRQVRMPFASVWLSAAVLVGLLLAAAPVFAALSGLLDGGGATWNEVFTERVQRLLLRTLLLGVLTALSCAALGVPVALLLSRRRGPLLALLGALLPLPLILPPWMAGLAWAGWLRLSGFGGAVLLLTAALWPLVTLFALRGLHGAQRAGEAAALARGRSAALWRVVLPLAWPSILSGMLCVFLFAITDFGVVDFLSWNSPEPFTVLSSEIFQKWARLDSASQAAAVSLPALGLGLLALAALLWLERRQRGVQRGWLMTEPSATANPVSRAAAELCALVVLLVMLSPALILGAWASAADNPLGTARLVGDSAALSALCAAGAGLLVALLGVGAARLALRWGGWREALVLGLALLPLAAPGVLYGVGVIRFWHSPANPFSESVYRSPWLLVLATAGRYLPLGVLAARTLLLRQDPGPSEAGRLSGRPLLVRLLRVELPRLAPALGLSFALGYLLSLRDLDVVQLVPAGNNALINRLFQMVHIASDELTAVLCLLLILMVVLPGLAARLLGVPGALGGRRSIG